MQMFVPQSWIQSKSFQELRLDDIFKYYFEKKKKKQAYIYMNGGDQLLTVRGVITNLGHAPKYS